jgi:hypothetical protein
MSGPARSLPHRQHPRPFPPVPWVFPVPPSPGTVAGRAGDGHAGHGNGSGPAGRSSAARCSGPAELQASALPAAAARAIAGLRYSEAADFLLP